eukprot:evm.model.NODE_27573_length_56350_cov_23.676434.8
MPVASPAGLEVEPVVAAVEEGEDAGGAYKCVPCDKAFQTESQHAAHVSAHEECHYPTCTFQGSRQVVGGHYRVAHGKYRGNGFRVLKVEGRSFRILVGNAPEEVEQWREDRRKNFPTAENVAKRREEMRGGGRGGRGGGGKKRPRAEEVEEGRGGSKHARAECGGGLLGLGEAYASEGEREQEVLENEEAALATVVRTAVEEEADVAMRTSLLYGVCRAYLRNQCPLSAARCRYRHGPTKGGGGLMYCRFFTKPGGGCHHGEGCQFVHDLPLKEELERWVVERRAQKEREAGGGEGEVECGKKRPGKTMTQQQQQQQQSAARATAAAGPSRELTLLKRLLGMEVEKETKLVLGCIRYLVEENFF